MKSHFRLCTWGKIAVLFLGLLIPSAVWAGDAEHKHSQDQALFSSSEYIEHLGYLAGDELEGRGTGQEGNDKAADYIAQYFAQCGLQPAGDNGTFFQQFPLKLKNDLGPDCRLAIGTQQRRARQPLRIHEDYMPYSFSKAGSFKGEVVFVGYGVASDQLGYDDFADVDVSGKVVLMLRRAPKFTEFSARDMSFRSKTSRANARDVAAILVANSAEEDQDDKLPEFNIPSRGPFGFGRASFGVPLLQIKRAVADRMLTAAGLPDLATLEKQIEDTKKPASQVLPGVTIKGAVDIRPVETMVRNVVGVIPGTGNHAD